MSRAPWAVSAACRMCPVSRRTELAHRSASADAASRLFRSTRHVCSPARGAVHDDHSSCPRNTASGIEFGWNSSRQLPLPRCPAPECAGIRFILARRQWRFSRQPRFVHQQDGRSHTIRAADGGSAALQCRRQLHRNNFVLELAHPIMARSLARRRARRLAIGRPSPRRAAARFSIKRRWAPLHQDRFWNTMPDVGCAAAANHAFSPTSILPALALASRPAISLSRGVRLPQAPLGPNDGGPNSRPSDADG